MQTFHSTGQFFSGVRAVFPWRNSVAVTAKPELTRRLLFFVFFDGTALSYRNRRRTIPDRNSRRTIYLKKIIQNKCLLNTRYQVEYSSEVCEVRFEVLFYNKQPKFKPKPYWWKTPQTSGIGLIADYDSAKKQHAENLVECTSIYLNSGKSKRMPHNCGHIPSERLNGEYVYMFHNPFIQVLW